MWKACQCTTTKVIIILLLTFAGIGQSNTSYADEVDTTTTESSSNIRVEHANSVYQKAVYILFGVGLLSLIVAAVYFRQLRVIKKTKYEAERALAIAETARAEAERSAEAKLTFLAKMSHEIRTPMNGVFGMAEALAFTELDKKQSELLNTLQSSAQNLMALLNDILDFSKMDAGKLTLESMPVNFRAQAKNIIHSFSHLTTNKNLQLTLHIDDALNQSYHTDPTRLTQVLNNLLSNALKFTDKGSIDISMQLIERQRSEDATYDTIKIAVKDTGIGISEDNQKLLFTPFIQADNDVTRKFGGTGLGLSICQEIINAMGGKIKLDSTKDVGSTFSFTLTFKQADFIPESEDRRKQKRITSSPIDDRFNNIRVLVADDNIINVTVITAQLERLNIFPDVAEDGKQALDLHLANPYDIIISDCHMPVMDGFELARKLIADSSEHALWLIAVTADALSGSAEKCLAAGFDDYLAKPCTQEQVNNKLYHAYRQLIRRRESIAQASIEQRTFTLFKPQLLLKENAHDVVLAKSFASIFIESWHHDKQLLLKALVALDYVSIHAITHKCKASVRYLCSNQLERDANQVEKYAQTQNKSAIKEVTKHFIMQLDLLTEETSHWLKH